MYESFVYIQIFFIKKGLLNKIISIAHIKTSHVTHSCQGMVKSGVSLLTCELRLQLAWHDPCSGVHVSSATIIIKNQRKPSLIIQGIQLNILRALNSFLFIEKYASQYPHMYESVRK